MMARMIRIRIRNHADLAQWLRAMGRFNVTFLDV